jgi:cardiolipin synthase
MRPIAFTAGNRVSLLHCGAEFFPALIAAIDGATFEVFLETYIFAADRVADTVKAALERAAARGVNVNVITDWIGTGRAYTVLLQREFAQAGVNHRTFNPWFRRGIARTHRKLCVVDRRQAFVGGLNIIDDACSVNCVNLPLTEPRWDFAVGVEGPLVANIHLEIEAQWFRMGSLKLKLRWELFREIRAQSLVHGEGPVLAALVVRDNLRNRRTIQRAYLHALGRARKSILFANPYFAPGRKLRRALERAAERGIDVTLLLGVGEFQLQDAVTHSFYPKLLGSGVKVVEYRKTQLHAKVAVVDSEWATIGSSNYDGLSLFVNQEANVVIKDMEFSTDLRNHIERGVADGVPVHFADYANIPWYKRVWHGFAFLIYEMIIRVVTWSKYS